MAKNRVVTAINCMDGRVQEPVTRWMTRRVAAGYVDMITEPAPVSMLAAGQRVGTESIQHRLTISVGVHNSRTIAVVGHSDCAGNPVDDDTHHQQTRRAATLVQDWYPGLRILALWVNNRWTVEVLDDSDGAFV